MGCAVWHRFRRFIPKHQFIVNLEENKLIGYTEQSISNDVFTFAAKDFMLCTIVWNDFIKTKITCFSTVHVFSSPVCRPLMSYYIQVNLHPDIREAVTDLLRFVSNHITTSVSQLHSIFAFFLPWQSIQPFLSKESWLSLYFLFYYYYFLHRNKMLIMAL